MKITKVLAAVSFSLLLAPCTSAIAGGPNDFFGGAVPGAAQDASDKPAAAGGGGDYTEDEKRMQKKFKANMQHVKDLIKKGELMMSAGAKSHDDKLVKKGKILKEIGEKNLASLEENNPFGHKDLQDKATSSKSASSGSP